MNWRGKMIGGSIGSFLGPWGTLAGAAVGHVLVDRKNAASNEKASLRLLAITAGALYELAGVDGRYTTREDQAIRTILGEINKHLGTRLSPHELAYLIDDASRIDQCLSRLASLVRGNPDLARAATVWLWRIAVSDCDPTLAETDCIRSFARHIGLQEEEMMHASLLYVRHGTTVSDKDRHAACHTLGVPYHADAATVKRAYRSLSLKYHPDKHAGLDPDIRALTADKFAQITAAYDTLSDTALTTEDWFSKQADSGRLAPATPEAAVLCFVCGQKIRLPPREHLASARCPACQTLLAFEHGLAEQLV
jgi:DnaJ-domain-containing protein 1